MDRETPAMDRLTEQEGDAMNARERIMDQLGRMEAEGRVPDLEGRTPWDLMLSGRRMITELTAEIEKEENFGVFEQDPKSYEELCALREIVRETLAQMQVNAIMRGEPIPK